MQTCRVVVLISGRGSNMAALVRAERESAMPYQVVAVIGDRPEAAPGLTLAQHEGIATDTVLFRAYPQRADFEGKLVEVIERYRPDVVALAGFMRVLGSAFVARYRGRLVNIHPSLLPAFPGLHTHRQALAMGVRLHGCTVHLVTEALDHGPILMQAAVPVMPDDSEETLSARVLRQEHRIYPAALAALASERLAAIDAAVVPTPTCRSSADLTTAATSALIWPPLPTT